jgi:DegV family protein with EDD domain
VKIHYLNGSRLYHAFLAGGDAVIQDQAYLNKINVFPVPDADTGTNMALTMRAIAQGSEVHRSIKTTLKSIANAALCGAQGNSGIIFAQFIHGFSKEIGHEPKLSTKAFGESVRKAVHYAYKAIVSPVEGTMITVIRDWAEAVYQKRMQTADYVELLTESLHAARNSLRETTRKLQVLAKAGVVDAGAKGFIDFLEGILHFIKKGKLGRISKTLGSWIHEEVKTPAKERSLAHRYCSEALLSGENLDTDAIRTVVRQYGDSAVVAGSEEKVRIHIHTNDPSALFFELKNHGAISQIKVDDMRKQYEAAHAPKSKIAIVTDSSCDLPPDILDDRQVHVIPLNLSFGRHQFLDKVTITPAQFYSLLQTSKVQPTTAVPPSRTVENLFAFLASHYESMIVLTISEKLSGVNSLCRTIAEQMPEKKITVISSHGLSATLGLLVARASDMALAGASHDEIVERIKSWIPKSKILVDVQTMKYLVRSGRVSNVKGLLARVLNIKPIITLDKEGKSAEAGKSFSRRGNVAKILNIIRKSARKEKILGYAIVHAQNPKRASLYERKLTGLLGKKPEFVLDVAPVIGAHTGIGTMGIALLYE